MRTVEIASQDKLSLNSFLHNRFDLKYQIARGLRINAGIRNRLFYGNLPDSTHIFIKMLEVQNDFFDLSFAPIQGNKLLFHSIIDRLYLDWEFKKLQVRIGRQRINLGVNLFWNPNDIFNVYSFYDIDYEERPGGDALLIRYYTGIASSVEGVVRMSSDFNSSIFAGVWKTNKWKYDYQVLFGKVKEDLVLGVGWSGSIGTVGFKGESSYFTNYTTEILPKEDVKVIAVGFDHSFSDKFFLNSEFLYTSNGKIKITLEDLIEYTQSPLTSKTLSPFKYSWVVQPVFNINPKQGIVFTTAWYIGENAFYFGPSYSIQLANNFDLNVIGQLITSKATGEYKLNQSLSTVRFKWSF